MPLISTLAGAASRAYGFLAKSLTFFAGYFSAGGAFYGRFLVDNLLNTWSLNTANDYSYAVLQKTNSVLTATSQTKFTNSSSTYITKIAFTPSNNLYIVGSDTSSAWLASLDSNGSIVWQRTSSEFFDNLSFSSSGIYVATTSTNKLVKYNFSGSVIDQYKITYSSNELDLLKVDIDASENIYIYSGGGVVAPSGSFAGLTKLDSSGVVQWQKVVAYAGAGMRNQMVTDTSGNIYMAFKTESNTKTVFMQVNSSGTIQWQNEIDVFPDESYATYVGTYVYFCSANYIFKFDTSGNLIWQRSVSGLSTIRGIREVGADLYFGDGMSVVRTKADGTEVRSLVLDGKTYTLSTSSVDITAGSVAFSTPYTYAKTSTTFTDSAGSWSTTSGSTTYITDAI